METGDVVIERNGFVEPDEIIAIRRSINWQEDSPEIWAACIQDSMLVVTARDRNSHELVGVGFLVANARHAQLVDVTVHSRVQRQGIGRRLVEEALNFAWERGIRYIGLTWDESKPWLSDFYESAGFQRIDNAMWHKKSLDAQPPPS